MNAQINYKTEILCELILPNGNYPNNSQLPVIIYKNVFRNVSAGQIEEVLAKNSWGGSWRNGVYSFHHYHSTAHESLGVYNGWAEVQLGGDGGKIVKIEKGDLVVLPAGISHKKIKSGDGFAVVGAYPDNQKWDMNYGNSEELQKAIDTISKVKLPQNDPVFGGKSKLFEYWK